MEAIRRLSELRKLRLVDNVQMVRGAHWGVGAACCWAAGGGWLLAAGCQSLRAAACCRRPAVQRGQQWRGAVSLSAWRLVCAPPLPGDRRQRDADDERAEPADGAGARQRRRQHARVRRRCARRPGAPDQAADPGGRLGRPRCAAPLLAAAWRLAAAGQPRCRPGPGPEPRVQQPLPCCHLPAPLPCLSTQLRCAAAAATHALTHAARHPTHPLRRSCRTCGPAWRRTKRWPA
jgi:hypothetical protein